MFSTMRSDRFITGSALDFMIMHEEWRDGPGIRRNKPSDIPPVGTYDEIARALGKSKKHVCSIYSKLGIKPVSYIVKNGTRLLVLETAGIIEYLQKEYHGEGYTPKELAKLAGCSSVTVGKHCKSGKLRFEKHGRLVTINREDGDRFVKEYKRVHSVETF